MRFIVRIAIFAWIVSGSTAYGCSLAPSYLPDEFGGNGVALGNIAQRANKIVLGTFTKNEDTTDLAFNISKTLNSWKWFTAKNIKRVSFRDVDQHYLLSGIDNEAFPSSEKALGFVKSLDSNLSVKPNIAYGVGGPIAGIFHGTDCERFVIVYEEQEYLVFLDVSNYVIARFAINKLPVEDIKAFIKSIDETLSESQND